MSDETQLTMRPAHAALPRVRALLREIGPYAAIELILPGGTLIVLLIWFCRRNDVVRSVIRACIGAVTRIAERPLAGLVHTASTTGIWETPMTSENLQSVR